MVGPDGSEGLMTMPLHFYEPRGLYRTWAGVNRPIGGGFLASAKYGQTHARRDGQKLFDSAPYFLSERRGTMKRWHASDCAMVHNLQGKGPRSSFILSQSGKKRPWLRQQLCLTWLVTIFVYQFNVICIIFENHNMIILQTFQLLKHLVGQIEHRREDCNAQCWKTPLPPQWTKNNQKTPNVSSVSLFIMSNSIQNFAFLYHASNPLHVVLHTLSNYFWKMPPGMHCSYWKLNCNLTSKLVCNNAQNYV